MTLNIPDISSCALPDWTIAWWHAFGAKASGAGLETRLYVLTFRNSRDELIAVAPFYEDQPHSPLRIRRLRPIGYLGRERAFDMTEEPTPAIRPGFEGEVVEAVVDQIQGELESGRWDFVALILGPEIGPSSRNLLAQILRQASFARSEPRTGSDYTSLPGTWQEYRLQLTKSMRENISYYPRLLTREGKDWFLRTIDEPHEMSAAVECLSVLHQGRSASTRGKRHSNHLHGESQIVFLTEFMRRTAGTNGSFITELVVNGEVVASQAFFITGETLTVSYSGFDEAFYRYSPIFIINSAVFKDAQKRGIQRLNFLRNMAPWKARWLAKEGPSFQRTFAVRRNAISMARYGLHTICIIVERDLLLRLPVLLKRLRNTFFAKLSLR